MATKEFEEISTLHGAIKNLSSMASDKDDVTLDDILTCIQSIDQRQFNKKIISNIASEVKEAVVELYVSKINSANDKVKVTPEDLEKAKEEKSLRVVDARPIIDSRKEQRIV